MSDQAAAPVRTRAAMLALVFGLAFAVRAWHPDHLGLGHYDEGVYAISASAVASWPAGDLFPGQTRFSPPAWFATVGVVARVADLAPHVVALSLNLLIGAAIATAAAMIGMAWFGTAAGVAAGIIVALDPLGIMLARSGLTDPAFTFWLLLAVAAIARAVSRGGAGPLLVAGACTGLAWNTKYHGWFALVIGCGAIGLMAVMRRGAGPPWRLTVPIRRLAVVAMVAAACYLPWALYMRGASGGRGLEGIVAYYLTLIGGDWFGRAMEHVAMQAWLDGPLARAAGPAALALAILVTRTRVAPGRLGYGLVALAVLSMLGGGMLALVGLAIVGIAVAGRRLEWPGAMLIAWVVLWVIAAPFYQPYARLLLPLTVALGIAAGVGASVVTARLAAGPSRAALPSAGAALATLAVALAVAVLPTASRGAAEPWRDARGSEYAAAWLDRVTPPAARIAVVGEPAIAYYLRRRGRNAIAVVDELASLDTATTVSWVAAGRYARRAPPIRDALEALGERQRVVGYHPIVPNDLRLLDDLSPAEARAWRQRPDDEFHIVLHRVTPSSAASPRDRAAGP